MARPCPCIAVTISVYAASASSGTGAAAVYGLPCCRWRSMPTMLLLALQLSLLEARLRLIHATLVSCLSRLPLHRFPLCRESLLCLGAHRGPLKGFRRLASAPLGVLRGLACLSRFATEERETDSLKIKGARGDTYRLSSNYLIWSRRRKKIGQNRFHDSAPQTRGFLTSNYYAAKRPIINPAGIWVRTH